jgi:hypothetical protein
VYAMEIAEASKQMLQGSPGKEKAKASPTDSKASCVKLCHGDIADRKVPFGKVVFLHSMHEAEKDDSCLKCHASYGPDHGKTTPKDCSGCHHGEGMGKVTCQNCHRAEERMFKGAGVNGVKDMKDWMRGKVTCQQCHTSVKQGKKESTAGIKTACAACHGKKYLTLVDDWIAQNKNVPMQFRDKLSTIEKKMDAIETKDKSHSVPMRGVLDEINQDMHFVFDGNWAHNPQYAEAIVAKISKNIQTLEGMIKAKEAGQPIIIQTKQNTDTKAQPQKK